MVSDGCLDGILGESERCLRAVKKVNSGQVKMGLVKSDRSSQDRSSQDRASWN